MNKQTDFTDNGGRGAAGSSSGSFATIADVAGEKLEEARQHLANGVEDASRNACAMLRTRPYQTLAIALGAGALLGYLLARRSGRD